MRHSTSILGTIAATALAACASQPTSSYPEGTEARLATYARATPCCDDPSGFEFGELPRQGQTKATIDPATPVFDFQSGVSPFAAFVLPQQASPYRIRVKSFFDAKGGGKDGIFYPVIALLDDTYIVVHMTGLENLRLEPALATPGGEAGLAASIGIDPAEQDATYLVVFTPAALLGKPPPPDREGDVLSLSSLAYMERRGEAALPASPYGRLSIMVAPEAPVAAAARTD
ncbi:MAG TPA: MalM family protein [Steroidobacteraceae bacterium]|nr:MalM family protein [Steroidobacteraceae bacterium]